MDQQIDGETRLKFKYKIGDKIVYPMHGAGVIESIKKEEVLGRIQNYYVVKISVGGMKVMIPTENVDDVGVRDIIDTERADEVFAVLSEDEADVSDSWNKRYRSNMLKIKSGDIFEVSDVVKSLMRREHERGLSTGERKMLSSAKQILVSELVLAKDMNPADIEVMLHSCVVHSQLN